MSLTAHELALRLAKHLEITSLDPADASNTSPTDHRGLREGDPEELAACINAALQELWEGAPTAIRFSRVGSALHEPAAAALTLTHGSNAISAFPQYASWMEGCTVRFEGEEEPNELVDASTLLRPWLGADGTVAATVYGDCANPGAEVIAVLDPVTLCGGQPGTLRRATLRAEFEAARDRAREETGAPEVCFVETRYFSTQSRLGIRLRVYPMPGEAMLLTYGARLNAPAITTADLGTDSDPGKTFPIPGGWEESVLLPLALQRLSAHPDFVPQNTTARAETTRQAEAARRILAGAAPQRAATGLYPVFR